MIDLYTYGTGNALRVSIMLEECGLAYRAHKVDLGKGEQNTPAFRKLNPLGKVPVIVDSAGPGGAPITMCQSGAILLHCAEKSGRFIPSDACARAQALQWMIHAITDGSDAVGGIFRLKRLLDKPESAIAVYENYLSTLLKNADAHLAGQQYLAGELSVADFAFYTIAVIGGDLVGIESLSHLRRWLDGLSARPGVMRGMAVPG